VASAYLEAWQAENYPGMYAMLTALSREAFAEEAFTKRYRDVAVEAALSGWDYEIMGSLVNSPYSAQVSYRVTLRSVLVGDIQRETQMGLSLENGQWQVQWDDTLILPELRGGNILRMEYLAPARANIYDRNNRALAAQTDAWVIGLDAGKVDLDSQGRLLGLLYEITGDPRNRPEVLGPIVDSYRSFSGYVYVGDVPVEEIQPYLDRLTSYSGVLLNSSRARYYFEAPHVTGYVRAIQAEEVEKYKRLGYNPYSDRIGEMGLETWGEPYLGGSRGGKLYLVSPEGATITVLAERPARPSQAIVTTIDKDLQKGAQKAMGGFLGAIVVLERDTGRVLALVSSPGYNPNLFEPTLYENPALLSEVFDPVTTPLLDRAADGQYPLGSVFKIITMAAALESDLYTPESEYTCGYFFEEIPGVKLNDWTYDHFLEDGKTPSSGILTLPEGLMRSCNPWFWHIGLNLYSRGMTTSVSNMARGFGLGSATGVEIAEQPGNIPDPASSLDATNLSIGQGNTLVTPLQVADFIAAVGNGGTLYTPKLVERVEAPNGALTDVFTPTIRGTLPITDTNLQIIQDAMMSVVTNPRGTAWHRFRGLEINIAGKTGTAQSGYGEPHAWFAGYTFENNPEKPDIAVVVIVESIGEGSDYGAPIFRRIIEIYFYGKPLTVYPWESAIGVVKTPTPAVTDTPTAEPPTPTPEEPPTETPQP
jgi:penicillin-binding protein 2